MDIKHIRKFTYAVIADASIHEVDDERWFHVGVINCDLCDNPAEYFHPTGGARCKTCIRP